LRIYPAIDIMSGKVVRLTRGKKESATLYGDPVEIARRFAPYISKIHVVDLDGAFTGEPKNLDVVFRIREETGVAIQVGGGFRSYESVERAYQLGVENVILSTAALNLDFLKLVTRDFAGITVSLDVKRGKLALKGWLEEAQVDFKETFEILRRYVRRFIYTSVEHDGTLEGIQQLERFWSDEEMIYAGGVSSAEDVLRLKEVGFAGVIVGKAFYEQRLNLAELISKLGDESAG